MTLLLMVWVAPTIADENIDQPFENAAMGFSCTSARVGAFAEERLNDGWEGLPAGVGVLPKP